MDFGFDVSAAAAGVSQASDGVSGKFTVIMIIAAVGMLGRSLFVAFGSSLRISNPLKALSGIAMILAAFVIMFGGMVLVGKGQSMLLMVQRNVVDPFVVSVLDRDSCDLHSGAYCVIVFEQDRERVVNWHDHRVDMFALVNPPNGSVFHTERPRSRPQIIVQGDEAETTQPIF
ncbi:hypothetical protein QEZ52_10980 [Aliisedimentitalea scapharcae]|uniref:Uncharacterized protein n=1 Tax=Aliisedimentitalea scapharcae TaxID=1524259 RepID=A0ABZ2XM63_9RHOB